MFNQLVYHLQLITILSIRPVLSVAGENWGFLLPLHKIFSLSMSRSLVKRNAKPDIHNGSNPNMKFVPAANLNLEALVGEIPVDLWCVTLKEKL